MPRNYIVILMSFLLLNAKGFAQAIETLNEIVLTNSPSKCYIVNNEGRIAPGVVITAANSFFMKANAGFYNSPSPNKNFVRTEVYGPDIFGDDGTWNLPVSPRHKIYEYFDGLGSLKQTITVAQSPTLLDHISFNQFDEFGRSAISYLPYTKKTGGAYRDSLLHEQAAFYNGTPGVAIDSEPFASNVFDNSPQNNIRKSFSVGWKWHNSTPGLSNLKVNTATEVKKLVLNSFGAPVYSGDQFFPKGTFTVSESADEAGFITRSYRDLDNQLILERKGTASAWHDTFYLYDISGNLKFIFPPEASSRLAKFAYSTDKQEFLDLWCFQFKHDKKGRIVEKKLPGADWIYYIYDNWNRVAMSQDGNQRVNNQWAFNKYDSHNRVIMTGLISGAKSTLEANVQQALVRFEERARNSIGYTNRAFPVHDENSLLTVNYYDCYQFITYPSWDLEMINFNPVAVTGIIEPAKLLFQVNSTATTLPVVRGKATGTKVKVLGQGSNRWINAVTFYNRQYQPVQIISENYVGGRDVVSKLYDKFKDVLKKSKRVHTSSSRTVTIDQELVYDSNDRLKKFYQTIDGKQRVLLVSNAYNELGQLVKKNLHSTDEVNFLQSVDYRYNIQGWLTHINNSSLTKDNNTNNDPDDLFGMEIIYNDPVSINGGAFKPLQFYDGNIAAIKWKTNSKAPGIVDKEKIYGFQYDNFKRFSRSYYATGSASTWNGEPGLFNETVNSYDANGNIDAGSSTGLIRNGLANSVSTLIDNLDYFYNGNQLRNVSDISLHSSGFTDKPGSDVVEFLYDKNGNLVHDLNRSISAIRYNHLNLPTQIEFTRGSPVRTDQIVYTYDALGNKLRKEVYVGGISVWRTDYVQGLQYDNGKVSFAATSEGRAVFDGADVSYEYFLRDFQNNVRVVCGLLKETDVYLATMESNLENQEKNIYGFSNITETRSIGNNTTRPSEKVLLPDRSSRCNGFSSSTVAALPVGPAKMLKVGAGDVVYAEVYSRFNNAKTATSSILPAVLGSYVTSAFRLSILENTLLRTRVHEQAQVVASGKTYADIVPKGYLALIFLDLNYNPVLAMAESISEKSYKAFEKLSRSFKADREGYVFIYVANESSSGASIDVFFDDFYIIHEKNRLQPQVIQSSDYYPFGLSFNVYNKDRLKVASTSPTTTYEPMLRNRYLFQGQELEPDLGLGWYQFKFRMHDPALGRFGSVDPLAEKYAHLSPYAFSGNQLTNAVELEGAEPKVFYETMKWLSPIAFKFDFSATTHGSSIGFNVSLGIPKSFPLSARYEWGTTYKAQDIITGMPATETRSGMETAYLNGLVSFKTTAYESGETSQKTGMVTVGVPFANIQYENDWHPNEDVLVWADPFDFHQDTQTDMFRTAALSANFGLYTVGFNLGTGDPGPIGSRNIDKTIGGKGGMYGVAQKNGKIYDPDKYRLGIGYMGVGPFRVGVDSEQHIRHRIQNVWTHDRMRDPSPWFKVMPVQDQFYFGYTFGTATQW